jgi:5-methylcytosine-specific restriction endonuclease McrA
MPDIVFLPNHADSEDGQEARLDEFLGCCSEGSTDDWTCKKMAALGDLYFFWFGKPVMRIAGVGVCKGDVQGESNIGADWTDSRTLWMCPFDPLEELKRPITVDHIRDDPVLATWWKGKPFRGRPKTIPEEVASRLISLCLHLNPDLTYLFPEYDSTTQLDSIDIPDDEDGPPKLVPYTINRRVRKTAEGERLKMLYECKCQVCGYRICVPGSGSGWYVEIHHLKPLGGGHGGGDSWKNMLVLCPTCHAEFDALSMAINPKTGRIACYDAQSPKAGTKVGFREGHSLSPENIKYHWKRFREAKGNVPSTDSGRL